MTIRLILLILFCNTIYSQNDYFELRTIKKSEVVSIERKFKSTEFNESQKHVYSGEERNLLPLNYIRKATEDFPASIVQYFYSPKDSLVTSISFDWRLDIDQKLSQSTKIEKYNVAFDDLVKSMSIILGEPNPDQGKLTEKQSPIQNDKTANYQRKVIWKIHSKTITTLIIWAENHGQQMITTIK